MGAAVICHGENLEYDLRGGKLDGAISEFTDSLFWGLIGVFVHRR